MVVRKRTSRLAAEAVRMYEADGTISIATIARRLSGGDDFSAMEIFVRRAIKRSGRRVRDMSTPKVERNESIRMMVRRGVKQAEIARSLRLSKVRVHQIVRGRDRG